MTQVSEVADGIYQIEADKVNIPVSPDLPRSSMVYFIIGNGQTALIETGPAVVVPAVLDAIRQLGYDPSRLAYAILTHIHLDHGGGAGTLAQQFPQLQIIVHQRGARHLIDPSRLIEGTRQAYGERFDDQYGPILPIAERQVRAVEDGEVIALGDRELKIIYAPGHAPHQMCIYETKSQGLFCGDALPVSSTGSGIVAPVAGFDLDAAIETLDRLSQLNPKIIFSPRGTVSREVARLIQSARANTQAYGDIILAAMKAGEGKERMAQRLEAYEMEGTPSDDQPEERRFDNIITWYVAHFKRKGVA
ncbi:MAG: MBL fold metallo-hydrolase [Chloroflexi bacterium]|nr:MBL fold metallo-hydrolase [Chloroflexota bacterium]